MKAKEELLKPRFKVIADYPNSIFEISEIIVPMNGVTYVEYSDNGGKTEIELSNFPHLFQLLKWWEERKVEDMPQYIEFNKIILPVKKWDLENKQGWICINQGGGIFHQDAIIPSSKEEYETNLKNNNQ